MKFKDALYAAQQGMVIGRTDANFPFDMLVLINGRVIQPSFGEMKIHLGETMDMSILHHFDGVNLTSRTSCELTLNVQFTVNDLMAEDWVAMTGADCLDVIFPADPITH